MATLHDAVDSTKKLLLFSTIGITLITVTYFVFTGILNYIQSQQAPPAPREEFGNLPDIAFPPNATDTQLKYSIDTVTGNLPDDLPRRMFVYELVQEAPDLNNLRNAKLKVLKIKFATRERRITDTVYQWTDLQTYSRTMRMDIVTGNFVYSTDFITNDAFLNSNKTLTEEDAVAEAREFFQSLGSFPPDLAGSIKTKAFSIENGNRIPADRESDIRVVEVNFFQEPISLGEEYPIYYEKPDVSYVNALVASAGETSVVEAHYTHHGISDATGEYALKPVEAAYEELQNGEGYIASYFGTDTEIKIQEVFLGYYIAENDQQYAMPIYIFSNQTKGFYAYVPAVDDYWNDPTPIPEQ